MKFRKLRRLLRVFFPALATIGLAGVLLATIYYTLLDWQWIAFLGGVLFAALLAFASRASRAEWLVARRSAQLNQAKERLAHETQARKNAEQAFLNTDERMRLIADAMPTMLVYVDAQQRFRYHNRAYREWIRLSPEQIEGKMIRDVMGEMMYAASERAVAKALAGERVDFEHTHTAPDGSFHRLGVTYLPHFNPQGQVLGFYGLLTEVIDHRQAAEAPPAVQQFIDSEVLLTGNPVVVTESGGQTLYLSSITEQLTGWSNPEARLRQALERDEFCLFCQPIVPVARTAGAQTFYEILVRLQEEEQNLAPPGAFIPVAERYNMMPVLDRWVVRHLIEWILERRRRDPQWQPTMYNINLFGPTLSDPKFPAFVLHQLEARKVPPQLLCFELNEESALERLPDASRFVVELRRAGCRFAIGGFGAGKVSFDSLKNLPVNFLKIDGGIIRDVLTNPVNLAKAKAISRVAKAIGVHTIAEFVESAGILAKLQELGIDYAQGFGIGRPHPLKDLA